MRKLSKSLSRRSPFRDKRNLIIISSEGEVTELRYFQDFTSKNIRIKSVDKRFGNDPISVVNAAINHKDNNDLKKNDEIWVVVDTDFSHDTRSNKEKKLTKAGKQCKKKGFGYAVSNPCFEFWFLLHYKKAPKISTSIRCQDVCIRLLKKHYPQYEKNSFEPGTFRDKLESAIENAKQLDQSREGTWPQNHGSTVYKLMESILDKL